MLTSLITFKIHSSRKIMLYGPDGDCIEYIPLFHVCERLIAP